VCGRDGIDDLLTRVKPVSDQRKIPAPLIRALPELLRAGQLNFAQTGGLHAACAVNEGARVLASAEDVGRHNAVDKVVGKLLMQGELPRDQVGEERACVLAVSGRASFEIVQKAAAAGFACVASVSAPSSLAIDTAQALGITLAAFVRDGRFTLYTHEQRVLSP
jgi:FdhD protein